MTIEIVFETHSISTDNEAGIATGWLQGALSEEGKRLARRLGARRRGERVDAIYTSDLRRAVETAEVVFGGGGVSIRRDARLRDCDYGELNGAPVPEVERERARRIDEPFPGGESYRQTVARMRSFLDDRAAEQDPGRGDRDRSLGYALGARPPAQRRTPRAACEGALRLGGGVGLRAHRRC